MGRFAFVFFIVFIALQSKFWKALYSGRILQLGCCIENWSLIRTDTHGYTDTLTVTHEHCPCNPVAKKRQFGRTIGWYRMSIITVNSYSIVTIDSSDNIVSTTVLIQLTQHWIGNLCSGVSGIVSQFRLFATHLSWFWIQHLFQTFSFQLTFSFHF